MSTKYTQIEDGNVVKIPSFPVEWRTVCCDCGAVHSSWMIRRGKGLEIMIKRHYRSQGQFRRWGRFLFKEERCQKKSK